MAATGSVLVDTSVVVEYLRQNPSLHERMNLIEDVYLGLPALGELLYGARRSKNAQKALAQVREFLEGCIIILPDETTADLYGQIKTDLAAGGKVIPENDIWIAAIAKQYDLPVATRDRHFSFVSGLTLTDW